MSGNDYPQFNRPMDSYLRLCYVKEPWAWFTTQDISKQWGDDWNDAPYEHNAGEPYEPYGENEDWTIVKVAYDGDFATPCCNLINSCYSVFDINKGDTPWLQSLGWSNKQGIKIMAGVTLDEFCRLIKQGDGKVYEQSILTY